jgi:hypothetical protein
MEEIKRGIKNKERKKKGRTTERKVEKKETR